MFYWDKIFIVHPCSRDKDKHGHKILYKLLGPSEHRKLAHGLKYSIQPITNNYTYAYWLTLHPIKRCFKATVCQI